MRTAMAPSKKKADAPEGSYTIVPTTDDSREPVFVVLAKRTYHIKGSAAPTPTATAIPLFLIDRYYDDGDPQTTTVQYESEVAPFKLATDFVVIGSAHAPGGKAVDKLDASVEIAAAKKTIRVFGDRFCEFMQGGRPPRFKDPQPFIEMEIRY